MDELQGPRKKELKHNSEANFGRILMKFLHHRKWNCGPVASEAVHLLTNEMLSAAKHDGRSYRPALQFTGACWDDLEDMSNWEAGPVTDPRTGEHTSDTVDGQQLLDYAGCWDRFDSDFIYDKHSSRFKVGHPTIKIELQALQRAYDDNVDVEWGIADDAGSDDEGDAPSVPGHAGRVTLLGSVDGGWWKSALGEYLLTIIELMQEYNATRVSFYPHHLYYLVADAAKDWLTPAPRVAEKGSMGTKPDGLPEHPPGPQEQQAISHKCDTAGCVTKRHLEFYNWTRENSLRAHCDGIAVTVKRHGAANGSHKILSARICRCSAVVGTMDGDLFNSCTQLSFNWVD